MAELRDADERRAALDPARSFLVQAPAGSGKTELLVRRYLTLLSVAPAPERILALTFTNKAAAEMRQRVQSRLFEEHVAAAVDDGFAATVDLCRRRARELRWGLRDNPARFRVMTLDGFNRLLVTRLPVTSAVGALAEPLEDPLPYYRRAAEAALAHLEGGQPQWARAAESVLEHMRADVPRAVSLLVNMLARRDQWLRHVHRGARDGAARETLESHWRVRLRHESRECAQRTADLDWPRIAAAMAHAARNLPRRETPRTWERDPVSDPALLETGHWHGIAEALLTKDRKAVRKSLNARTGFPADAPDNEFHRQAVEPLRERLMVDAALRRALRRLPRAAGHGDGGGEWRFSDAEWRVIEAANTLLPLAVAELRLLFRRDRVTDFIDLAQAARRALGDEERPTDLAMALDHRIDHILVDEFQDTSWEQLEMLRALIAEWRPDEHRTLFMVGDPMQSIYRFRKAEVGIFLNCRDRGIAAVPLTQLRLRSNFRSGAELVTWANRCFAACFPAVPDAVTGGVPFDESSAVFASEAGCGVHLHALADADEDAQGEHLADLVAAALESAPERTLAVLVRSRRHLRALTPVLRRRGVPCSAVEIEPLSDRPAIRDLSSLVAALTTPADDLAWLSLLRSPCCGLGLHDLAALRDDAGTPVYEALRAVDSNPRVGAEGRQRAARLLRIVEGAFERRAVTPFRDLVETAWRRLGGDLGLEDFDRSNAAAFLDLVEELGPGPPDPRVLSERLATLWARPESLDARVQLLTIHKAKGLEWDTVIVPCLERPPRSDPHEFMLWQEIAEHGFDDVILQAPIPSALDDAGGADEKYRYLRDLEREKSTHEALRLLYVACTRAARDLHLVGSLKTRGDGFHAPPASSFLGMLWPVLERRFLEAVERRAAPRETPRRARSTLGRLSLERLADGAAGVRWPVLEAAARQPVQYSWAGEVARRSGVAIHRILHRVAVEGLADWNAERFERESDWVRFLLRDQGLCGPELEAALARCRATLEAVRADPVFEWIIDPAHRRRRFEWPLTTHVGERACRHVLDCSFVDSDDRRWIIDFKTGSHGGGALQAFLDSEVTRYRPQLESYAEALARIEDRACRLGLYFPLIGAWRRWEYRR